MNKPPAVQSSDTNTQELNIEGLKRKLFPYQKTGVLFIDSRNGRALVADEMGLGKTLQSLAWLQMYPKKRPAIIVVPSSVKLKWAREVEESIHFDDISVTEGRRPYKVGNDIIIINYDIVQGWSDYIRSVKPKVIIIDECHYIKSSKAKRTKAVKKICRGVPHIIALSGTPVLNKPIEIYNTLNLIDRTVVPSFWEYAFKYCNAKRTGFGWDLNGASNTRELHHKLINSIMIRRKKSEVLKDLPEKILSPVPIEMTARARSEYNYASNNFLCWVRGNKGADKAARAKRAESLTKIESLKQIAVRGKLDEVKSWIRDFLESDEKLVVFAIHTKVIDSIYEEFKKIAVKIDGSVRDKDRQRAVDLFQMTKRKRLFVGQITSAGVGLDLTAASNVAFIELPWTPGEVVQAEDRCHRIGQKYTVNVYYLLASGTIEYEIAGLIDKKRKVLDQVLDGKKVEKRFLITELIEQLSRNNEKIS